MAAKPLGWTIAAAWLISRFSLAHMPLEGYLREAVGVTVSASNIDIAIQFDFPADSSLRERTRMDANGDGLLSREEQESYLANLLERGEQALKLTVDSQALMLIPLSEPILDMQDSGGVEAHPHVLKLSFFARIPETFGVGSRMTLESGLWTDTPCMISASTEAGKGIRIRTVEAQGLREPSANGTGVCVMEAQCTQWEPANERKGNNDE